MGKLGILITVFAGIVFLLYLAVYSVEAFLISRITNFDRRQNVFVGVIFFNWFFCGMCAIAIFLLFINQAEKWPLWMSGIFSIIVFVVCGFRAFYSIAHSKFCEHCGTFFFYQQWSSIESLLPVEMNYCQQCGAQLPG